MFFSNLGKGIFNSFLVFIVLTRVYKFQLSQNGASMRNQFKKNKKLDEKMI